MAPGENEFDTLVLEQNVSNFDKVDIFRCVIAGVSNLFSLGATSALQLPSKGQM